MTHLSCPPVGQPPPLLLHSTVQRACLCVCVTESEGERQTHTHRVVNRRTGRLVICLSAFRLTKHRRFFFFFFCDYTVYFQVWIKGGSSPPVIWECVLCLSMWRESNVPRHAFQACLLTWWLPWEQPDSGRLCTSLLGGIVRTERRFKGEESLWVFILKKNP